ncbi:hypothetical protein B0H11DRAFT_1721942 [Mycena galericulata]|nr:hypothetical protein B0H11DRAFT_1721942 [Mycena galericulata]
MLLVTRRRLVLPLFWANARVYSTGTQGPNHAILEMLKSNKEEEAKSPDKNPYKIRAFTSAIKVISELEHPIQSATEAKALKGVGPGIFRRIQDFFEGHTPDAVDPTAADQLKRNRAARAELEQVTGIGPVKARELVEAGCMTLEQLKTPQYMDMLTTTQQRIGVTYFHHLEKRVTREEAETVAQFIRDATSSKYEVIIGGSYRRGADTSSDIDLIVLHPEHVHVPFPVGTPAKITSSKRHIDLPLSVLQLELVPALTSRGILAAAMSSGGLKWQGIVFIPERDTLTTSDQWGERQRRFSAIENGQGVYRRMDLNLVAQKSRGAALISLTGDIEFIRDLRIRASKLGMHLNEYGLWRWNESSTKEDDDGGFWELVRADTEEEVLRELGMEYVEPVKRNFSLVLGKKAVSPKATGKKRR